MGKIQKALNVLVFVLTATLLFSRPANIASPNPAVIFLSLPSALAFWVEGGKAPNWIRPFALLANGFAIFFALLSMFIFVIAALQGEWQIKLGLLILLFFLVGILNIRTMRRRRTLSPIQTDV